MNRNYLRAFHLVAREGSFTRAARSSGLSQPNLSGQVKALETGYGVSLFERRGRTVQLTALGSALQAITERLFALEEDAEALLSGAHNQVLGALRVSADNAVHALPIMAEIKRRHADVILSLNVGNSDEVLADLMNYRADVGVTAKNPIDEAFHVLPYRRDRLVLFVPKRHPWASRTSVAFRDLEGADMVLREPGSVTREVFDVARESSGIGLGRVMVIQSREAVREAVAAGFGMGVAFDREFTRDPRFARLAIDGAALDVGEYVVTLAARRHFPGIRAFLDVAARMVDLSQDRAT
ncbi:MAG: LysR substrate-binding domain-containing protein [Alphaproteobacteria bacterium]